MRKFLPLSFFQLTFVCVFLLISFIGNAQIIKVEIQGGANVTAGSTQIITAGNSQTYKVTNSETSNCKTLKVKDINLSAASGGTFSISPSNPKDDLKPASCNGNHDLLFTITRTDNNCTTATVTVTLDTNEGDFTYTFRVERNPKIYVSGGSPLADINHGSTLTSSTNGTYFGVVSGGNTVTRRYIISNVGSCNLTVSGFASSNGEYTITPLAAIPASIAVFGYIAIDVTFTAPIGGSGTKASIISISNTDNTTFTFRVSSEMFNYTIPGPGGITADFRLWLKGTRGILTTGTSVDTWRDLGTNAKDATSVAGKKPTYLDDVASNINFNPVIKFENNGAGLDQYLLNDTAGFFSQDIFIVTIPDAPITNASPKNTLFAGTISGVAGDITGVGFGNYTDRFTNETLSYNQNIPSPSGSYNGEAIISANYSKPGIINVRNDAVAATKQQILYNSKLLTTTTVADVAFANVNGANGSKYWIGKNLDGQGTLNGRVAEIFTFASRVNDAGRQKIESYLAIKYGITLGASNIAEKDYVNSFGTKVWDIATNTNYNYDVAGIGKDSISDLYQRQSKTINLANDVTIGLDGLYTKNSLITKTFTKNGDFLVWGNNNGPYTGTNTNLVTVAAGITTSLTRIDRKWKIVETKEIVTSDVGNVYVGIPENAFSGFTLNANEEYVLIVADNANFANNDIIDVIPLKINSAINPSTGISYAILDKDGSRVYTTWYNFDDTKYFTFGKASRTVGNRAISIAAGDYLVGESGLNLSVDNFSIASWIKCAPTAAVRTVLSKGEKLQIRLNTTNKVEILIDDLTPKYISNMSISDNKWHHLAVVYESGTILLYIDGILDKSVQNVVHPSPNFNNFCVGAVYLGNGTSQSPLLGDIDEVSVWDIALSENQVRYIMNQEIKNEGGFISGKVLPFNAASNEITTSLWSGLRVYYDFNNFYGSTIEGLTSDRYFLRLRYLSKNKSVLKAQTIPVPFTTVVDGAWDDSAIWLNSADNMLPNAIGLDGTTRINWNIVQIGHNITSGDRNISVLGLISTAGTLTIADPTATTPVENNAGQSLTISHYLELDGVIDLVGESQLIQTQRSIIDADSGGYIERDQQGTANGFNYNYWSSSVGPIGGNVATKGTGVARTNSNYTISGVLNDGTNTGIYQGLQYNTAPDGSGSIPPPGTARTISSRWLYKFYGPADQYNAWVKITETSSLLVGEAYTMKGTGGSSLIPIATRQNYVFKGLPNNGDISLPLDKSAGEVERLIGNPYPSAIDATEFILDNISIADGGNNATGTVINGALYFWDHFGQANSHILREYVGGYATRNLTGGAAAISNDMRINDNMATGTKVPGQFIPANQGFFVSTALSGFNNENGTPILSVAGGTILFKNRQRIFVTELEESSPGVSASVFMKTSKGKTDSEVPNNNLKDQTPTIRLMYDSPLGYHRQIVIGANKMASNGFDLGYDALMVDVNVEDMYWNFSNNKFVIQGVADFNASQEFSLGLIVKNSGIARIKLDALENIPTNMAVYIKDNISEETFKINSNTFEVYLEAGVYNDRFKLVFQANQNALSNTDEVEINDVFIYSDTSTSNIKVINKTNITLTNLALYNLLGQEIIKIKLNTTLDAVMPVTVSAGAYIVKLNTSKGIVNRKIIIE